MPFTESTYENAIIQLFEGMGYTHIYAPDMGREDFSDPLMGGVLRDALVRINRGLPLEAIGEALSKIRNFEGGSLFAGRRGGQLYRGWRDPRGTRASGGLR